MKGLEESLFTRSHVPDEIGTEDVEILSTGHLLRLLHSQLVRLVMQFLQLVDDSRWAQGSEF